MFYASLAMLKFVKKDYIEKDNRAQEPLVIIKQNVLQIFDLMFIT